MRGTVSTPLLGGAHGLPTLWQDAQPDRKLLAVLSLALVLPGVAFLLHGHVGYNAADEGFLWYGVLATLDGELPIRDFQSYDPGRYLLAAVWAHIAGSGLVSLRLFLSLCASFGLVLALVAARKAFSNEMMLFPIALLHTLWLFPFHKLVDHTVLLSALWVGFQYLSKPLPCKAFGTGIFVGLAAFLGRNHGVYLAFSLGLLVALYPPFPSRVAWLGRVQALGIFGTGILVGYLPMEIFLALVPGFWGANLALMRRFVRYGGTNLSLPVPWPWKSLPWHGWQDATHFAAGLFFVGTLLFYCPLFLWILWQRPSPLPPAGALLVASVLVGLPYTHHAFSRADLSHLAQSIHPLLLGLAALTAFAARKNSSLDWECLILGFLLVASSLATWPSSALFEYLLSRNYHPFPIGKDLILLPPAEIAFYQKLASLRPVAGENPRDLLLAGRFPGLYPLLERKSPAWELYFLLPAPEDEQLRLCHRLETLPIRWILWDDSPLDGRPERRLRVTHPLLWNWVHTHNRLVREGLDHKPLLLWQYTPAQGVSQSRSADSPPQ